MLQKILSCSYFDCMYYGFIRIISYRYIIKTGHFNRMKLILINQVSIRIMPIAYNSWHDDNIMMFDLEFEYSVKQCWLHFAKDNQDKARNVPKSLVTANTENYLETLKCKVLWIPFIPMHWKGIFRLNYIHLIKLYLKKYFAFISYLNIS